MLNGKSHYAFARFRALAEQAGMPPPMLAKAMGYSGAASYYWQRVNKVKAEVIESAEAHLAGHKAVRVEQVKLFVLKCKPSEARDVISFCKREGIIFMELN